MSMFIYINPTHVGTTKMVTRSDTKFLKLGQNKILDFCNTYVKHKDSSDEKLASLAAAKKFFSLFFNKKIKIHPSDLSHLLKLRAELKNILYSFVNSKKIKTLESQFLNDEKLTISFCETNKIRLVSPPHKEYVGLILTEFYNLLLNSETRRIKKCKNNNCSHLFFDKSKNNSRVWCSMSSCGNLIKSRNFYKKKKLQIKSN
jgi:hypothetical protein